MITYSFDSPNKVADKYITSLNYLLLSDVNKKEIDL